MSCLAIPPPFPEQKEKNSFHERHNGGGVRANLKTTIEVTIPVICVDLVVLCMQVMQARVCCIQWGTCTLRQCPWKNDVIASLGGIASAGDHSQTESGRPFLFTFPFETLKSCCVLGCFSGAGRDRTISYRLPPINRPRLTKVLHNLRTKRVYGASTSSA